MARRYTKFTPAIGKIICELTADGISLNRICKRKGMPGRTVVYRWLHEKEDFARDFLMALELKAEHHADLIIELADQRPRMFASIIDGKSIRRIDPAWVNQQRLRIDVRKWIASKLKPKKYGDSLALTGKEGLPLIPPTINLGFGKGGPGDDESGNSGSEGS